MKMFNLMPCSSFSIFSSKIVIFAVYINILLNFLKKRLMMSYVDIVFGDKKNGSMCGVREKAGVLSILSSNIG